MELTLLATADRLQSLRLRWLLHALKSPMLSGRKRCGKAMCLQRLRQVIPLFYLAAHEGRVSDIARKRHRARWIRCAGQCLIAGGLKSLNSGLFVLLVLFTLYCIVGASCAGAAGAVAAALPCLAFSAFARSALPVARRIRQVLPH